MSLRAIIIDDEMLARARIRTLLREHPDITIADECANAEEAIVAIHTERPDLIFVDVQMPEMSGLEMLREIDPARLPLVVFVTAHDAHALEAFRANAVQYLVKPIDRDEFRLAMARVRQLASATDASSGALNLLLDRNLLDRTTAPAQFLKRVVVKTRGRTLLLKMPSIDWFESHGNYVRVHLGRERYLLRQTMTALEEALNPQEFVRVHRTAIVNLDAIVDIATGSHGEQTITLRDGTALNLSRVYRSRIEPLIGKL
jgi:two-component system, LytTR family, response regulator